MLGYLTDPSAPVSPSVTCPSPSRAPTTSSSRWPATPSTAGSCRCSPNGPTAGPRPGRGRSGRGGGRRRHRTRRRHPGRRSGRPGWLERAGRRPVSPGRSAPRPGLLRPGGGAAGGRPDRHPGIAHRRAAAGPSGAGHRGQWRGGQLRRSELAFYDFREAAPGGRLQGFFVYRTGEETFGEDLATLAELVADGRLEPQLGMVRDWSDTTAAVEALRSRQATGKVVLTRS